jgi:hypothetical protein
MIGLVFDRVTPEEGMRRYTWVDVGFVARIAFCRKKETYKYSTSAVSYNIGHLDQDLPSILLRCL